MNKYLLHLILCSLMIVVPCSMYGRSRYPKVNRYGAVIAYPTPTEDEMSVEGEDPDFVVTVSAPGKISIRVVGSQGKVLRVYNVVGDLIYEKAIDSDNSQNFRVRVKKGIYFVKLGEKVRKVFVIE